MVRFCPSIRLVRALLARAFQSHLGSILPRAYIATFDVDRVFQSHLGSILPHGSGSGHAPRFRFQSHLGSILPFHNPPWRSGCFASFNPTLVRFCPETEIRRSLSNPVSIPPWFDFALHPPCADKVTKTCFNPTLVRFCRGCTWALSGFRSSFQSHLGSILPSLQSEQRNQPSPFQSHLGSILPQHREDDRVVVTWFQSHLGSILPDTRPA